MLKLIWVNCLERLSVALSLFLGWTILVAIDALFMATSFPAIILLGRAASSTAWVCYFICGNGFPTSSRSGTSLYWPALPVTTSPSWARSPYRECLRDADR